MIELCKAELCDISEMQMLVLSEIKEGTILNRTDDEIATNIRSYILAKIENKIVAYAALHVHSERLAEIRSLIVDEKYRGNDIGKKIVNYLVNEARKIKVKEEVLVLTYLPQFFLKLGFIEINKEEIPEHKIWADCIKCIHFPVCNEISLVYKVNEGFKL